MAEPFPRRDVDKLLVDCQRRCCICHRFCGVKMETAHIRQGGPDTIGNAIPLCFECHAEIGLYNPKHPRGRRFTPEELRRHKARWLRVCKERPEVLVDAPRSADAGTFESLVSEIEFNVQIGSRPVLEEMGCLFEVAQFHRAIADGTYQLLEKSLQKQLRTAYMAASSANARLSRAFAGSLGGNEYAQARNDAQKALQEAGSKFQGLFDQVKQALDLE